jgi:KDO2-lipid IV(A) lauroyltransferase
MKKISQLIGYIFFRLFTLFIAVIPLRLMYGFSDFAAFALYRLVGYRKKVAVANIERCFPDLSQAEKQKILKNAYSNLGDMLVESLKGITMSRDNMAKRFRMTNLEVLKPYFDKNQSIIGLTAHFANWEWGASASTKYLQHQSIALYKPLSNKFTDAYMRRNRNRFGLSMIPIYETAKMFKQERRVPACYFLVADQSPSNEYKAYWTDFFGKPTAFLHGPEVYARMHNLPVLYFEVQRAKRGYYDIVIYPIAENPQELSEGEITLRYSEILEKVIRKNPGDWVWTHKRWKHDLPEGKEVFRHNN